MIYDSLKNAKCYETLSENFKKAFDYLSSTDLNALPEGKYAIDGDNVYIMVQTPALKPWAEGRWEAHRAYADIQVVISGEEVMGFCQGEGLAVETPYDAQSDVLFYAETAGNRALVRAGEMMVFFPQDAHRPCMLPEGGNPTNKKAVVKVKL